MAPRVTWIPTGGTIEAVGRDRLDLVSYGESGRRITPAEILAGLPELAGVAEVRAVPWADPGRAQLPPSHAWTLADLTALARLVRRAASESEGVVVTCGTNGLEETAYFLDRVLDGDSVPVVVTGAMRPASALGRDGPANLLSAVRVAAHPGARGCGVLVALDDAILPARDATKATTYHRGAFRSPAFGPLGFTDADGAVVLRRRPAPSSPRARFDLDALPDAPPRVDVIASYLGADGALVEAAVTAGARGIVHAGLGAGHPTPGEWAALKRAADAGVLVCQAARAGSGRVVAHGPIRSGGFVASGDLSPWKARVLLSLALARGDDAAAAQAAFDDA
ncbi:asparaginase [Actinomadura rugatobispora]|uniref:Asparaginase n=1 Tax=Actinomadura rugatobispora TaxID=1994 RepID=A0ABW1AJP7_9ACTN|nr:asparaginase [Actinomadura rugatobispora]